MEKSVDPSALPALALAYIGDAVYELRVREYLLRQGLGRDKMAGLHKRVVGYVNAERQSRLFADIESLLSEEELTIFRHGRNARSGHQPPHLPVGVYRRATGVESLIGYLYLAGETQRLDDIFTILFMPEQATE